ncbi:MAG: hypothetical protein EA381_01540, partial [Planctomycetaceae bacterium]
MAFVRQLTAWFDRQTIGRRGGRARAARKRRARDQFECHLAITTLENRVLLSAGAALMDDGDAGMTDQGNVSGPDAVWSWDDPATFADGLAAWLDDNPIDPAAEAITIELNPSADMPHAGLTLDIPDGLILVIRGGEGGFQFTGASPALIVASGDVIVEDGGHFSTSTDDPTIIVQAGGSLTLRNTTVLESDAFDQTAILVEAGAVLDLSSGDNRLEARGAGQLITWQAATNLDLGTNTLRVDGSDLSTADLAGNFAIEDRVTHGLDQSGFGLVTWSDSSLYVTTSSGSVARAIELAAAESTIYVSAGTFVHDGPLLVDRELTIIGAAVGEGETILLRDGEATSDDDHAIRIDAPRVTFESVTFGGWTDPQSSAQLGQGYLVWLDPAADQTTFQNVRFVGQDNRGAIHLGQRNDFTLTASRFEGTFFRAAIRGAGERMLVFGNRFEQSHFAEGPLSMAGVGDVSGVISFNYFVSRIGVTDTTLGNFDPDGTDLFSIGGLAADRITADGLTIVHNTFHFRDNDLESSLGNRPVPIGIEIEPTIPATGLLEIRDNVFQGYRYTGPQPPVDPILGYAIRGPAETVVANNVFFDNDVDYDATLDDAGNNLVGDPNFNLGQDPSGPDYQVGFGGRATYASSEFGFNPFTATPHVGAFQGNPGAFGQGDLVIHGSSGDDLLEIFATGSDSATARFTRDLGGASEFVLDDIQLTGVSSVTFRGYDGDDRLVIEQPVAGLFAATGGITFWGDDESGLPAGNPPGDRLEMIGGTAVSLIYQLDNAGAGEIFVDAESYLRFDGVESIRDGIAAAQREFHFPVETTEIVVGDDSFATGSSQIGYSIGLTSGPEISFVNPTWSLSIWTAAGSATAIEIDSLAPNFDADLRLVTGSGDQITFVGALDLTKDLVIEDSAGIEVRSGAVITTTGDGKIDLASAGTIQLAAELVTTGTGALNLAAGLGIDLSADLDAGMGDVSLIGDSRLLADVGITTTGGAIEITGAIDGGRRLEIDAGEGSVLIAGAIGSVATLAGLSVVGRGVQVTGGIRTSDASILSTGAADVSLGGDVLVGALAIVSGRDITITGDFEATISATLEAAGDIDLQGSVTGNLLDVDADGGVTIGGVIEVEGLVVQAAAAVRFEQSVDATSVEIESEAGVVILGAVEADTIDVSAT